MKTPNNLLRSLLYSKLFESEKTKYGQSMEPHAIQKFISESKRLHKSFNVSESGLVFMEENPFIRTSPGSNVDCSCCGRGLLEVTIKREKREKPSHENLSFLILGENGKVTLKQNNPFFYQVQGQMGVTRKNHCDFFVYTHFGIHQQRITLNSEIWKNIFQTLQQFWYKYLAPEIILQKLQAPPESISLHDQGQAQTDKSIIYTKKNDSATSPIPEILTQNALKRKLCNSPKNDSPSNILDLGQSKPV